MLHTIFEIRIRYGAFDVHLRLRAGDLAGLIRRDIFDLEDAAQYLGVEPETVTAQVYRGRIASVKYGGHRYFALGDLEDYRESRDRGRGSALQPQSSIFIPRFGRIG